ncbi:MAG: NAD(P)-binding protein [Solirubrobacterales bacterium]|nr:NAD(P)-binding protein [Solirubrobacterales bacterium]
MSRSSAIVIGAGLAGLVAADELAQAEVEVTVIEARERVGGRTWSRELANGALVEMGAEFVLPQNTEVTALASELGLGLWAKGMRYGEREPRGGIGTSADELAAAFADVRRALERLEGRPSARALLDSLAIGPGAREAILARVEISSAAAAEEIPATNLAGLAQIGAESAPSVAGGNQGLALGLAARLGAAVRLGDAAVEVDRRADSVVVRTASGRDYEADRCVIAVPASVSERIDFRPGLPRATREALVRVSYGHAAKLFVPLSEPAPPSAVMSVPERYWCWTATGAGDRPTPLVSCFAGSPGALERLQVTAGAGRWLESLAVLRPDLALEPAGALLSTWDEDPWVGAAYSIPPEPELTAALAEPVGPLAFAGEHLGGPYAALMEGAVRSGRAAARRLLGRL